MTALIPIPSHTHSRRISAPMNTVEVCLSAVLIAALIVMFIGIARDIIKNKL